MLALSRVYRQDGRYLVSLRYPGQWNFLQDFVQPANPDVAAIFSQYGPDYWSLFDFVCRHVNYRNDPSEFWQFPSETLARQQGDCEDSSILLTSLIRASGSPNCYVGLGNYRGYGHAWVDLNGLILETTYTQARLAADPEDYCPYVIFNDMEVVELWPGAMEEVFELGRDEATKLELIAESLRNEVPLECPSCWPFLVAGGFFGAILGTGFAMILHEGG